MIRQTIQPEERAMVVYWNGEAVLVSPATAKLLDLREGQHIDEATFDKVLRSHLREIREQAMARAAGSN